jgi:hypothetical protein
MATGVLACNRADGPQARLQELTGRPCWRNWRTSGLGGWAYPCPLLSPPHSRDLLSGGINDHNPSNGTGERDGQSSTCPAQEAQ